MTAATETTATTGRNSRVRRGRRRAGAAAALAAALVGGACAQEADGPDAATGAELGEFAATSDYLAGVAEATDGLTYRMSMDMAMTISAEGESMDIGGAAHDRRGRRRRVGDDHGHGRAVPRHRRPVASRGRAARGVPRRRPHHGDGHRRHDPVHAGAVLRRRGRDGPRLGGDPVGPRPAGRPRRARRRVGAHRPLRAVDHRDRQRRRGPGLRPRPSSSTWPPGATTSRSSAPRRSDGVEVRGLGRHDHLRGHDRGAGPGRRRRARADVRGRGCVGRRRDVRRRPRGDVRHGDADRGVGRRRRPRPAHLLRDGHDRDPRGRRRGDGRGPRRGWRCRSGWRWTSPTTATSRS